MGKGKDAKVMRKKLTALLLACLLLVGMVLPVSAAESPVLYGTVEAIGGTVTVTIRLKGGADVGSGAFSLSYDTSLTLEKAEKGFSLSAVNTKQPGKVLCDWVGTVGEKDQTVLTLTFTKAGKKDYVFHVTDAKVADKDYKSTKIDNFDLKVQGGSTCPAEAYEDVDLDSWYHDAVDYVLENNLMVGTGADTFAPNATLTRAMVVTIMGRAAGIKASDYTGTSFKDVTAGAWYAPYVQWGSKEGLVAGYADGTFKPNQNVTREEMVSLLYRFWMSQGHVYKTNTAALKGFKDADAVASWAETAVCWAVENGVVSGVGAGKLDPKGQATRAQFARIMMVYLENLA